MLNKAVFLDHSFFIIFTFNLGINLEYKLISYADDPTLYFFVNFPSNRDVGVSD